MTQQDVARLLDAFARARRSVDRIAWDDKTWWSYPAEITAFFQLLSQAPWTDAQYQPARDLQRLDDAAFLAAATPDELRAVLTAAMRAERFSEGAWKTMFDRKQLEPVMTRLAGLFGLEHNEH